MTVLVRGFNLAWPPLAYSIRDDDEARRTYAVIVTYYVLVSFTVVLALSLEARWVVRALAAPQFFRSYEAIPLVADRRGPLRALPRAGRGDRPHGPHRVQLPGHRSPPAVNLGLNLLLVPPYDIVGAGIALVASYVVMLALMQVVSRRLFPVPLRVGEARAHRGPGGGDVRARRATAADRRGCGTDLAARGVARVSRRCGSPGSSSRTSAGFCASCFAPAPCWSGCARCAALPRRHQDVAAEGPEVRGPQLTPEVYEAERRDEDASL